MNDIVSPPHFSLIKKTALYDLHIKKDAKMVNFAGWSMPVQYRLGVMAEHQWCRTHAGLFDVSHMGQIEIWGQDAGLALEKLLPSNVQNLGDNKARYSCLLNQNGGIEDDLIISNAFDEKGQKHYFLVVNASRFDHDLAILQQALTGCDIVVRNDLALIALQGPKAQAILKNLLSPQDQERLLAMKFMETGLYSLDGVMCRVSRLGYTGEDGFEISIPQDKTEEIATKLLNDDACTPIGLGARDSLRLEAGLCLYGNDLDDQISPIEANLGWIIQKRRREEGGFLGDKRILHELSHGAEKILIGILPEGKAPARRGVEIINANGENIGEITSGGFAPTLGCPISMGYIAAPYIVNEQPIFLNIRGKSVPAQIKHLPFNAHNYKKP